MRTPIVLLAAGEDWESAVIAGADAADVVVLKRCVDLTDVMATASLGQARIAVVSCVIARLDAEAVQRLRSHDVDVIAVGPPDQADRMARLGVSALIGRDPAQIVGSLAEVVAARLLVQVPEEEPVAEGFTGVRGRTIAIWGPAGAPGRTTVAVGIAAEAAAAGARTILVDADPYGGCVATRLGILDEASGLLTVARSCNAGTLDRSSLLAASRRAAADLDVLTGLPRADRRVEVRPGVLTGILEVATELADVVVDTGFSVEEGERDRMTAEALLIADEVVVVGQADPVGLARLARALVELNEVLDGAEATIRVAINRFRTGHGWSRDDVADFLAPYAEPTTLRFIPDDPATLDRSLAAGRTLVELGDSRVRSGLALVAQDCWPTACAQVRPKRRRAARARLR